MNPPPKLKRIAATAALTAATLMVTLTDAHAAAGDLDPAFGTGGKQVLPFTVTEADNFVSQPDGKVIVTEARKFSLARVATDGTLDGTFGGDGVATAAFSGKGGVSSVAVQPDGKIVAAGVLEVGPSFKMGVARFRPNGSLDPTFDPGGQDGDGRKLYNPNGPWNADGLVVLPDGGIMIGGSSPNGFTVARLSATGAEEDLPAREYAEFADSPASYDATLTPNGKIVVVGSRTPFGGDRDTAIARFNADGSLDKTFAGTGKTASGPGDGDDYAQRVVVQPDGKTLVLGTSESGETQSFVKRFTVDGKPDPTFGDGGTAAPDFSGEDVAAGLGLQADGKILVGSYVTPQYEFAAARLDQNGVLDPTYGQGGRRTVKFDGFGLAHSAGLDSAGRFVIAGAEVKIEGGVAFSRLAVTRLLADPPPGGDPAPAQPGPVAEQPTTTPEPGRPSETPPPLPRCAGKAATIVGTPGKDRIRGTSRGDVIVALGGADTITGLAGNDVVCGGAGNDVISGGRGRDTLRGEAGRDKLTGGAGRDKLVGGAGRDVAKQ